MKFRKKPVIIDAVQFNLPCGTMFDFDLRGKWFPVHIDEKGKHLIIETLEGNHRADPGDWIIRGVKGEFYPCKDSIFQLAYEPVAEFKRQSG